MTSFHKGIKLHDHNIYAEELAQTSVGFLLLTSGSVSPYGFCLVDSVGPAHVFQRDTVVDSQVSGIRFLVPDISLWPSQSLRGRMCTHVCLYGWQLFRKFSKGIWIERIPWGPSIEDKLRFKIGIWKITSVIIILKRVGDLTDSSECGHASRLLLWIIHTAEQKIHSTFKLPCLYLDKWALGRHPREENGSLITSVNLSFL